MGRLLEPLHLVILGPLYAYSLYGYIAYRVRSPRKDWPNPYVSQRKWGEDTFFLIFWWLHTSWACLHTYVLAPLFIRQMHQLRDRGTPSVKPFLWFVTSLWFYLAFSPMPLLDAGKGRAVAYSWLTYRDNSVHALLLVILVVYLVHRLLKAKGQFSGPDRSYPKTVRKTWTGLIGWSTFMWIIGGRALPIMALGELWLFDYETVNTAIVVAITLTEPLFFYYYVYYRPAKEITAIEAGTQ